MAGSHREWGNASESGEALTMDGSFTKRVRTEKEKANNLAVDKMGGVNRRIQGRDRESEPR